MIKIEHERYTEMKESASPAEVADDFLYAFGYSNSATRRLVYHQREYYEYTGTHYKKISTDDLKTEIIGFIQRDKATSKKANISFSNNVLANINAKIILHESFSPPCFLDKKENSKEILISFKNGVLNLNEFIKGNDELIPHHPNLFSLNCLPFEYDSSAICRRWDNFLYQMLPDEGCRLALQEWFGNNLTSNTDHQIFVMLVGDGANGKSVVCVVLRELLGDENVSSVSLEQFDPVRTFPLSSMEGKYANIVEEIGEVDKVGEGLLKQIVTGGKITVEKKNKDPRIVKFTAKLTFATNVIPRFRDRTSGLWRRMLPIYFGIQILDVSKQDSNLINGDWWKESGELRGVMNWALRGLARLNKRGYFLIPESSKALRQEFKNEANPAAEFLIENIELFEGGNLSSNKLYKSYSSYVRDSGGRPLGKSLFTKEIKRTFPNAILSENVRTDVHGQRCRVWLNLRVIKSEDDRPNKRVFANDKMNSNLDGVDLL